MSRRGRSSTQSLPVKSRITTSETFRVVTVMSMVLSLVVCQCTAVWVKAKPKINNYRHATIFLSMIDFLAALQERVLVCDGAMGTMLYNKGIFISRCFDELNVSNPDLVRDVHHDYIKAGSDIIETNTFGGNRPKLMAHGLVDQMRDI